jgi:YD repeat-containing protein
MANEFGITSYEYDGLDQITKVITPRWGTQEYIYDDLGNRLTLTTSLAAPIPIAPINRGLT